jgi:phage gp29-like protein
MGLWQRITSSLGFGQRSEHARAPAALSEPEMAPVASPSSKPARMPAAGVQHVPSDDTWIMHPGMGLVPARLIRIFRAAETGELAEQNALFDDQIEADGHVRSLFDGIETEVHGKPIAVAAEGDGVESKAAADVLIAALDRMPLGRNLHDFVKHQSQRRRYGYAATEIEWGIIEEQGREWVVPVALHSVEARRFRIDHATKEWRLTTSMNSQGEPLFSGKWLIGVDSVTCPARGAKMRTASRLCLLKSVALTNWSAYGNKYGIPLALVQYARDTGDDGRKHAEEIARNVGRDAAAAVPDDIKVTIAEAGRMGDSSPLHGGMVAHCNGENSKLISGGTLTNDSSGSSGQNAGSSHALGKVHENSRWSLISGLAADVQETYYELARLFIVYNGLTGVALPTRMQIQIARDLTPTTIVQAASAMVNDLGVSVSRDWLLASTGMVAPESESDAAPGRPKASTTPAGAQQ